MVLAISDLNRSLTINITTMLTVICWIFLLCFIVTRFSKTLKVQFDEIVLSKARFLMWLIPVTAMAFSLYFSEVLDWVPCKLCWIQRAFMYPLAIFMMLNFLKENKIMRRVAAVFCLLGASASFYHILIEKFPNLEGTTCDPLVPCSIPPFQSIGFIKIGDYSRGLLTVAGMAFTAFISVLVILYISKEKKENSNV